MYLLDKLITEPPGFETGENNVHLVSKPFPFDPGSGLGQGEGLLCELSMGTGLVGWIDDVRESSGYHCQFIDPETVLGFWPRSPQPFQFRNTHPEVPTKVPDRDSFSIMKKIHAKIVSMAPIKGRAWNFRKGDSPSGIHAKEPLGFTLLLGPAPHSALLFDGL
jgi:hypothetical protein